MGKPRFHLIANADVIEYDLYTGLHLNMTDFNTAEKRKKNGLGYIESSKITFLQQS